MAYSDAQKALAVEIVSRYDGEITSVALSEIRQMLNAPDLPKSTIWRWLQSNATAQKSITPEAQAKAAKALDEIFEDTARAYLKHATREHVVNRTSGNAAVTAAAIAVDKMRLLRNLPTEIVQIMPMLVAEMDRAGMNASDVFHAMLTRLKEQNEVKGSE